MSYVCPERCMAIHVPDGALRSLLSDTRRKTDPLSLSSQILFRPHRRPAYPLLSLCICCPRPNACTYASALMPSPGSLYRLHLSLCAARSPSHQPPRAACSSAPASPLPPVLVSSFHRPRPLLPTLPCRSPLPVTARRPIRVLSCSRLSSPAGLSPSSSGFRPSWGRPRIPEPGYEAALPLPV